MDSLVLPLRIVPGSQVNLVDAGADGLCSTADDTVLAIPVDLPTAFARGQVHKHMLPACSFVAFSSVPMIL